MTSYLIAGPGEEPVTLAEAKAFCRVDGADDDALLTALIAAARLHIEGVTGRALIAQKWRLQRDGAPARAVPLPVLPVRELIAAPNGAVLQGDCVLLATPLETLTIDYVAGYGAAGDVPADLRQALLVLVAYWYEHRDTAAAPPPSFERLLDSYRQVRL